MTHDDDNIAEMTAARILLTRILLNAMKIFTEQPIVGYHSNDPIGILLKRLSTKGPALGGNFWAEKVC